MVLAELFKPNYVPAIRRAMLLREAPLNLGQQHLQQWRSDGGRVVWWFADEQVNRLADVHKLNFLGVSLVNTYEYVPYKRKLT